MREVIYRCNVCNIRRGESNHWFVAEKTNVGIRFHTWGWAVREERLDDDEAIHLCGQGCAHTLLSGYFTEQAARWAESTVDPDRERAWVKPIEVEWPAPEWAAPCVPDSSDPSTATFAKTPLCICGHDGHEHDGDKCMHHNCLCRHWRESVAPTPTFAIPDPDSDDIPF